MENEIAELNGIIELNWPGKAYQLESRNGKWIHIVSTKTESRRALVFDSNIGSDENTLGYAIDADALSAMKMMQPYLHGAVRFIYFDAPRLNVFQSASKSGFASSTWLSLVRQSAANSLKLLKRNGFFAIHTDEQMAHYARLVLNEVFGGESHYVGTLVWQKQYGPQNDLNVPTDVMDYITVYSRKPIEEIDKIGIMVKPKDLKDDGDFRGCFIDGHKGARSGSEATKFKVNAPPYRWRILDSNLPEGNYHFDSILGSIYFESTDTAGNYFITVEVEDKDGRIANKKIEFEIANKSNVDDNFQIHNRIWWLFRDDNDIVKGGDLTIVDLPKEELAGRIGDEFSIVFKAKGGTPFTMSSDSPGTGRYWEFGRKTLIEGIAKAQASFGSRGTALPSIKKYFPREDAKKVQAIMNFLPWYDFGHTQEATQHCKALNSAGITSKVPNMMAKPQRLLGQLVQLFAPEAQDKVLVLGDSNGVLSSVCVKMGRAFIHVIGSSDEEKETWDKVASKRIIATSEGKDTEDIEGNDNLPNSSPHKGHICVLSATKSYLLKQINRDEVEPYFNDAENISDFYAGLAGAYRQNSEQTYYTTIGGKKVIVVSEEDTLDAIKLDTIKRTYPDENIVIIYESIEKGVAPLPKMILRRAPFELL